MTFTLAQRAHKMNPSVIREILKVTEKPGIISFAGGLPSPETFPVQAMQEACNKVLSQDGKTALQYAASEGYGPLRDWVAQGQRLLVFNRCMALALVLTAAWMLWSVR